MPNIEKITEAIDEYLEFNNKSGTTPVDINPYLESKGLLNDSKSRRGKPIRELIRSGKFKYAIKFGGRWIIHHSKQKP